MAYRLLTYVLSLRVIIHAADPGPLCQSGLGHASRVKDSIGIGREPSTLIRQEFSGCIATNIEISTKTLGKRILEILVVLLGFVLTTGNLEPILFA